MRIPSLAARLMVMMMMTTVLQEAWELVPEMNLWVELKIGFANINVTSGETVTAVVRCKNVKSNQLILQLKSIAIIGMTYMTWSVSRSIEADMQCSGKYFRGILHMGKLPSWNRGLIVLPLPLSLSSSKWQHGAWRAVVRQTDRHHLHLPLCP